MDRKHLAVIGAPLSSEPFRVELALIRGPQPRFEQLHADEFGSISRVFRGQLRIGAWTVPAAVKVQHDERSTGQNQDAAQAEFDNEREVLAKLAAAEPLSSSVAPVAGLLAWDPAAAQTAELEPSILCANATHALTPRCSACEAHSPWEPIPPVDDLPSAERSYRCPTCKQRYQAPLSLEARDAILQATVQRDSSCASCAHKADSTKQVCLKSALPLNLRPSKVLLFELLDMDLHDFLQCQKDPNLLKQREWALKKMTAFQRAQAERNGAAASDLDKLRNVIALFKQMVEAVRFLHARQVAHLDLQPQHFGLKFEGARAVVKLLDWGRAEHPGVPAYLRQAAGAPRAPSEYAALEVARPIEKLGEGWAMPHRDGTLIVVEPPLGLLGNTQDPLLLSGDWVQFEMNGSGPIEAEVVRVESDGAAAAGQVPAAKTASPCRFVIKIPFAGASTTHLDSVAIVKQHGPAADIYSLGLILVSLLVETVDLKGARDVIRNLATALRARAPDPTILPHRRLLHVLDRGDPDLVSFFGFLDRLNSKFGPEVDCLAEDLFAMAILCVLRGPGYYLQHRGQATDAALARLQADLERVEQAAAILGDATRTGLQTEKWHARIVAWLNTLGHSKIPQPAAVPSDQIARLRTILYIMNDSSAAAEQAWLLHHLYHDNRGLLADDLGHLLTEHKPALPGGQTAGNQALVLIASHLLRFESRAGQLEHFVEIHQKARNRRGHENTELKARLQRWEAGCKSLFDTATAAIDRRKRIQDFVVGIEELFFEPFESNKGVLAAHGLNLELGREVRSLFQLKPVLDAARALRSLIDTVDANWKTEALRKWQEHLENWRGSNHPLRGDLTLLARQAKLRCEELQLEHAEWRQQITATLSRIQEYVGFLETSALFRRWEEALSKPRWYTLGSRPGHVCIAVTIHDLQARKQFPTIAALKTQLQDLLGPYGVVKIAQALAQLETMPEWNRS